MVNIVEEPLLQNSSLVRLEGLHTLQAILLNIVHRPSGADSLDADIDIVLQCFSGVIQLQILPLKLLPL